MSWKSLLPPKLKASNLSFEQCHAFSEYYKLLTRKLKGPIGYRLFYQYSLHLLFYGMCCIEEEKYPALNRCYNDLSRYFLNDEFDNEWMIYFWMLCDFPLERGSDRTAIDSFRDFLLEKDDKLPDVERAHREAFFRQLGKSRLGFYQEVMSTKKVTRFRELFTGKVISTVRSVPDYDSGEIFVGRIVSYLDDSFLIHDPRNFPPGSKPALEDMLRHKFFYVSETDEEAVDYDLFMRKAGPYVMSVTNSDPAMPVLLPDHCEQYY